VDGDVSGDCRCKARTTARKRWGGGVEVGVGEETLSAVRLSFISRRSGTFAALLLLLLHGEIEGRTRTRSEKDGDEDTISHPGAIGRMRGRKGLNKSSDVPLRRVDCDLRW
jgi:hypothetical protein